ncbi:hypothetical protein FA13DRAFT_1793947 [Coprinellus micaceus]|uniref:Wax synthase domain-containing protein n=1 Tax=Coprinellus micaceus TaxID=71717 RepID=A0A4Y7T4F0_COPMI|nr:hypothetical protein FA13DRAFT_1793947 [Coprinellus micaceus]
MDFSNAAFIAMNIFMMSDFLLLTDVQNELRRKGERGDAPISKAPFFDRLRWGFDLFSSNRGIGWEHEPTTYLPRWTPATTRFGGVVQHSRDSQAEPELQNGWCSVPLPAMVVVAKCPSTCPGSKVRDNGGVSDAGAVSIGLGLSEPAQWPPLFGSFLDAYTVQNVWGRVWHQMFRRFVLAHANFVVKIVRPTNKTTRGLMKLFTAFLISSLAHYLIDSMALGDPESIRGIQVLDVAN